MDTSQETPSWWAGVDPVTSRPTVQAGERGVNGVLKGGSGAV